MEGRRRVTLYEQMSASDSGRELAGLTLDDVLGNLQKRSLPSQPKSRTLLDIIKEDETNKKDRRSWKAFKDKLRLKRAGSAWTSSIQIPTSDVPIPHPNSRSFSQFGRRNSVSIRTHSDSDMSNQYMATQVEDLDPTADDSDSPATPPATAPPLTKPQFSRRSSTRFTGETSDNTAGTLRPQLSRRNSTTMPSEPYRRGRVVTFRDSFDEDEPDGDGDDDKIQGRALSAREAVAAQEASEAAAAAEAEEHAPVTMSLMDLLEETDREMGLEGSRYILSDDEDFDEEEAEDDGDGEGAMEHTCCICKVRHKAAAFIPCGHTFCRMCSRELMVSRGNCPLCNNFILEILDIF
ncbi:hypothetical protein VNO77_19843 [Canavalia gladiata]|uniref:RING-type domain-containing protein n=1 Tax=Canavalia gladiata TaxID=3824 RepID=A0AAN9LN89_CANGL